MNAIKSFTKIIDLLYGHGWDERNGGNLSYILTEEEVKEVCDGKTIKREFHYDFDLSPIVGKYFVITGTGKYFKNCLEDPEHNIGIVKVLDAHNLGLVWGLENDARPTSETPTHLQCHIERLKVDPNHRMVLHCHPANIISMTHICPVDAKVITDILWKMQTESIVVFPEGVAILPWMVCGGQEIGDATAALMKEYRSVIWAQHGIFCTGTTLDETYGLVETIEKAAEIYMHICDKKIYQSITNEQLIALAKAFNISYRKGIID